jgi:16S rRNA (adenine1518-N6/adenine1519-N6)-dimethyltransferase
VRAKKRLGQHFLTDASVAERIAYSLAATEARDVLELGPGTGMLTQFLLAREDINLHAVEVDAEAAGYLRQRFPELAPRLACCDFLKMELAELLPEKFCLIGNFPYNISSQILFKVLELRNSIPEVVCMLQQEVAARIAERPGSKTYGILSVLLQAYYGIEYLFAVEGQSFAPPPKVRSAVVRLTRNNVQSLPCDETLFRQIVKTSFNQRRKALRNSLKPLLGDGMEALAGHHLLDLRPEQLGIAAFVELTTAVESLNLNLNLNLQTDAK